MPCKNDVHIHAVNCIILTGKMCYKCKLDDVRKPFIRIFEGLNAFVEIETQGSVVRNDKGYSSC